MLCLADAYYHGNKSNKNVWFQFQDFQQFVHGNFYLFKLKHICRKSNVNDQQCVSSMGFIFCLHLSFSHLNSIIETSHLNNIWEQNNISNMKLIAILGILLLGISMSSSRPQKKNNNKMPMPVRIIKLHINIYFTFNYK